MLMTTGYKEEQLITGVYKKQEFGRAGGKTNSYFDFLGKIYSIFPCKKSKNRDLII